jgi:hypothetical protein
MNELIDTLVEEETNLVLHTKLCAQRYEQITERLVDMENRFDRLEEALVEIRDAISRDQRANYKLYLGWAAAIITTLTGACGFLIAHYIIK